MRSQLLTTLFVVSFLAANSFGWGGDGPSTAPNGNISRGGVMKFQRISVHDAGINNMEAISFLIPSGWKTEGGIKWFPDYSILANLLMRVSDPQTGATIEFLPIQNFTWMDQPVVQMQRGQNYMGNIYFPPVMDLNQAIQTFYAPTVAPQLKGARPVGQQELPKIEQAVNQQYGGQSRVVSGRVRYEFNANGRPFESDVYLTIVVPQAYSGITIWQITSAYSFTAPKGQLDSMTPVMAASVASARVSQDWFGQYCYVSQLFQNRMRQGIKNAADISATITKNSEEIRQMFAESYKNQQASEDRISQSWSETIRGVTTYANPFEGRPVELPSGYDNAWVNARGEYLLSNEAGFNPNEHDTQEWRPMQQRGN